ncbi:hypothetical protein DKL61_07255 [Gammaproteobacteria bacterium ESL0073]|nr:hypothetical protein DKL61_07255 [Gammaproteobacteria bacterium ESL0073]
MKKIGSLILSLIAITSVQAQPYKCKQENGKYLFSDMPCVSSATEVLEKTKIDYDGVIVYLAVTADPSPLPNRIVNQFLDKIDDACKQKDGQKLFSYFSTDSQEKLKFRIINNDPFTAVSYACSSINNIKKEVEKSKEPVLFASKKPGKSIELCLYTAKKGLENCLGNTKIIAEQGDLKLDNR